MLKRIAAVLLVLVLMVPAIGLATDYANVNDEGNLVVGSKGDRVKQAQQKLKDYGYYKGAVSGTFDSDTEAAVRAFQAQNGLKVDGKIGPLTWDKLVRDYPKPDVVQHVPTPKEHYGTKNTFKYSSEGNMVSGTHGKGVEEVQKLLKQYGYFNNLISGKYGSTTISAVKAFQSRNGLKADGKVGGKTLAKLLSGNVVEYDGITMNDTANNSLVLGSSGGEVEDVQKQLKELLYYTGLTDGIFDTNVQNAVKAFQKNNGLTADGIVGTKTWDLLFSGKALNAKERAPKYNTIAAGSNGEEVEELQLNLRATYFYTGKIDGVFGPAVAKALKEFQAAAGLTADGKAGASTQKALYNRTASMFNGGYPLRTLRIGSRGWDVKVLQEKLADLNFLTAKHTVGYYDSATAAAVKKVQKANNLKQDGVYGKLTRRHLWPTALADKDDAEAIEKSTKYDLYLGKTLKLGASGEEVAYAQMKLKSGGYLLDNGDGVFGESTQKAVLKLQKDYGLKEDGIIGSETWVVIRMLSAGNAEPTVTDESKPAVGAHITKLRLGSRGAQVTKLQQRLITLGYMADGQDDGKFGPITAAAVKAFQKDQGIKVDGVVGTNTLVKLQLELGTEFDI